jgi:hypothetical protein
MKAFLAAALLALAALSVAPSADASQQPPPCGAGDWACPTPVCRQAQVDETDMLAVIGALGPWGMVYTGPHFGVRLNSDCTVDTWATWPEADCLSYALPLAYQEQTVDAGRVGATVMTCGVGFICACMPADVSSASATAVCPSDRWEGPFHVTLSPMAPAGCSVQVDVKAYDCVWNCDWHTYLQGPPVTVRVYEQNNGETSSVQPPSPCGPTALCQGPECPVVVPVAGLPAQVGVLVLGCRVSTPAPTCVGPTAPGGGVHVDGLVPVAAEACRLSVDCTCDPLPIDRVAASSLPPIFQPCPGMGGCCGIEPEGGCPPSTPQCPEASVSTTQLFGFLGPSAAVATHSGCSVDAYASDPACPSFAPNQGHADPSAGPVRAHADTCSPSLDCTCDPLPIEAASAAAIPPIGPCQVMDGCCGFQPPEEPCCTVACPPGPPACPEAAVATSDVLAYIGPHFGVALRSNCTVSVWEAGLVCPRLLLSERGAVNTSPLGNDVHADTCVPPLDCTCDPILAPVAAAALQPPVTVEFPVCVTDPCPPKVTCHVAPHDLVVATVLVDSSCHVTVVEAPPGCQAVDEHPIPVGPVTVIYWTCSGGPDDQ